MFAEALRALTGVHTLRQKDVAELTGLSRQTLANLETQKTSPSFDTLERLSEFFAVSIDSMVRGDTREAVYEALKAWDAVPEPPARSAMRRLTEALTALHTLESTSSPAPGARRS